jgi:hypothetical protein
MNSDQSPSAWACLRQVVAPIWGGYKKLLPLLVLVLIVFLIAHVISGFSAAKKPQLKATKAYEYAYVDAARVASYLAQVDGDSVESESRQVVTTKNSNLGLEANDVGKASTSTGSQLTSNVVVARTLVDKFNELGQNLSAGKELSKVDADARCGFGTELDPSTIPAGKIIVIEHARVRIPAYLSVYPELRYASYALQPQDDQKQRVFGRVPLTFRTVDESVRGRPRRERKRFKKTVGSNPRIPFTLSYTEQEIKSCTAGLEREHKPANKAMLAVTVFLPARFVSLTGDPSLLETPLTIVGMVVSNSMEGFGDGLSVSTYWPALSVVKSPLLRELGVEKAILKMKRVQQRKELFAAMEQSVTFSGHVVEIVPIAMYDQ